jgi:hypothetical protein
MAQIKPALTAGQPTLHFCEIRTAAVLSARIVPIQLELATSEPLLHQLKLGAAVAHHARSQGSFGVVYKARCLADGRVCCLKKIAVAAAQVGHPLTWKGSIWEVLVDA